MAVFIRKERLGSRPPSRVTGVVERSPIFHAVRQEYAKSKKRSEEALKEKYEANAEVQRWRTQMTPDERARDAIERMVPTARAVQEMRSGGKEVSYEEARKKAESIAYLSERKKKED